MSTLTVSNIAALGTGPLILMINNIERARLISTGIYVGSAGNVYVDPTGGYWASGNGTFVTGWYESSGGMNFRTASTNRLFLTSTGSFGVGGAPNANRRLEIFGAGATSYDAVNIANPVGGGNLFLGQASNGSASIFSQGGGNSFEIGCQGQLVFTTGGTAGLAIARCIMDNAGRIGFGTTTPNTANWSNVVHAYNSSSVCFKAETTSANIELFAGSGITGLRTNTNNTPFYIGNAVNATALVLDATANVNIGTPIGQAKVTVQRGSGAVASTTISAATSYLALGYSEYSALSYRMMALGYYGGGTHYPAYMGYQEIGSSSNTYGDIVFLARGVSTDTQPPERLRITGLTGDIVSTGGGGVGYGVGSGGSVTQASSKSTAVTINSPSGNIITSNAALATSTTVAFMVNNTAINQTDTVIVNLRSGNATVGTYRVWAEGISNGSFAICIRSDSGSTLSEALTLNFNVIRGSAS